MPEFKCGCILAGRENFCPCCGAYQYDLFLSESFPENYDSPTRKILQDLHSKTRPVFYSRSAAAFLKLQGNEKWTMIATAIKNSEICIFDISDEIFNVGFELGYALTKWNYTGNKKYILIGSNKKPEYHKLNIYNIIPLLPKDKEYSDAIEIFYREGWEKIVAERQIWHGRL